MRIIWCSLDYLVIFFDGIDFFVLVNFFVVLIVFTEFHFRYSSNVTLITHAIGIASMIQRTPQSEAQRSMTINTKNGERSRARLIT